MSRTMEENNEKQSSGHKVVTSEQLQKLRELQQRRQQIQKAQDERDSKKKKRKSGRKGKKNATDRPEAGNAEQNAPDSAPTEESRHQRHRVDIENQSISPSRDLHVFIPRGNPGGSSQKKREIDEIASQIDTHNEAASLPAPVVKEGGGASATSSRGKRKKLYWGLDSKERWERKSNM